MWGVFALSYLLGSIPFGLVLTKLAGLGDIRSVGSGNVGATNVLRTGNKFLAALTLFLDGAKGAALIIFLYYLLPHAALQPYLIYVGLFAVLGHCFPIWLKFKGGKGVATTLGVLLAAVPIAGASAIAVWLLIAFTFKISSLAALSAMAAVPVVTFFVYGTQPALVTFVISILVFIRHKDNIRRILKGEESKIGEKAGS